MTSPFNSQLIPWPEQERESDERYTPRRVFDGHGLRFDTDPASPIGGGDCVPATVKYTRADDGLAQPWRGLVWLNPPFSESTRWADRFRHHGNGVFLGPIANGRWWCELVKVADIVWCCRDFAFTHPTHAGKRSSMPLAMIGMGPDAAAAVGRLARSGVQDGVLLAPERTTNPVLWEVP
jgi:hypothetical protein